MIGWSASFGWYEEAATPFEDVLPFEVRKYG